jgi:hypothetical protein
MYSHSLLASSVTASSPHPHGEFDEDTFYKVRTVLAERFVGRRTQYKIDWEDDERTGEKFAPTWEPKENLTEVALADWEKLKLSKQASMSQVPVTIRLCLKTATRQQFVRISNLQLTKTRTTCNVKQQCSQIAGNTCQGSRKTRQNSESSV